MCFINLFEDEWSDEPREPGPRPSPRLTWAVPVDIVELGASLEAYSSQLPQITTLRLCHRFGAGPLCSLPQEILDQVISQAQEVLKNTLRAKWTHNYLCFQGRCIRSDRFSAHAPDPDDPWDLMMTDWLFESGRDNKDFETLTEEKKREMFQAYVDEEGHDYYDDRDLEEHYELQQAWLRQVCSCHVKPKDPKSTANFHQLHKSLHSHFGLDAIPLHEKMSPQLVDFLPDSTHYSSGSYYTSCFLGLKSPDQTENSTRSRIANHRNNAYLRADNHLAYHRVIDPNQFAITEQQKSRFARAMRILSLQPHYHITELDSVISANTHDKSLWATCDRQVQGGPKPSSEPRSKKRKLFQQYLHSKNQELSKQEWPQFMLMSTSDAVSPSLTK